jgi:Photosynthetic reaction centre cytochrome C subunit
MKGMPASRLMSAMNRLTQSLGVACSHCHVPDALDKDDNPTKQTARKMFEMVRTINATLGANRVTCYTCHRGQPHPASTPPAPANTASKSELSTPEIKPADPKANAHFRRRCAGCNSMVCVSRACSSGFLWIPLSACIWGVLATLWHPLFDLAWLPGRLPITIAGEGELGDSCV